MLPTTGRGHMLKERVSRERTDTTVILGMYTTSQFMNTLVVSLILQEWQLWLLTRAIKCRNALGRC